MDYIGSNFDRLDSWDRWLLVSIRVWNDPLMTRTLDTPLNVIRAKEKLHLLFTIQPHIAPCSKVSDSRGSLPMQNNASSTLLCHCHLSPTSFGRGLRDASNVPSLLIYRRLLDSSDATDISFYRWQGLYLFCTGLDLLRYSW